MSDIFDHGLDAFESGLEDGHGPSTFRRSSITKVPSRQFHRQAVDAEKRMAHVIDDTVTRLQAEGHKVTVHRDSIIVEKK